MRFYRVSRVQLRVLYECYVGLELDGCNAGALIIRTGFWGLLIILRV